MADNMSASDRSRTMASIRSSGNVTTEQRLQQILEDYDVMGWVRQPKVLGKPDFAFLEHKVAVFVDGCYWHGCPRCKLKAKTNTDYWDKKIRRNRARDRHVTCTLETEGWTVVRFWEHSLSRPWFPAKKLRKVLADPESGKRKYVALAGRADGV